VKARLLFKAETAWGTCGKYGELNKGPPGIGKIIGVCINFRKRLLINLRKIELNIYFYGNRKMYLKILISE